jgi:hypothetical protein
MHKIEATLPFSGADAWLRAFVLAVRARLMK